MPRRSHFLFLLPLSPALASLRVLAVSKWNRGLLWPASFPNGPEYGPHASHAFLLLRLCRVTVHLLCHSSVKSISVISVWVELLIF